MRRPDQREYLCPAATNIFFHGNEEQGQLANEVRLLWGQNHTLKEQLSMWSRGKVRNYFRQLTDKRQMEFLQISS